MKFCSYGRELECEINNNIRQSIKSCLLSKGFWLWCLVSTFLFWNQNVLISPRKINCSWIQKYSIVLQMKWVWTYMYLNICQYLYLVVIAFVLAPATIAAVVNESIFFKSIFRQGLLALQATVLSTELAQVMFFTCPRLAWGRGRGWNLWKPVHTSA